MGNPPKLSVRFGCPLALAVAAALTTLYVAAVAHVRDRPIRAEDFRLFEFVIILVPFAVLAVARTRDWLGWLTAIVLTGVAWGWFVYEISLSRGVNFVAPVILLLVAPLLISGLSLSIAGMRGRIPDWGLEQEQGEETIAEIGIAEDGGLFVRPSRTSFDQIYRAAMEVHWDPAERRLFGPKPREWTYARWFGQILAAVEDEYGVRLRISAATQWTNVPEKVRAEIEAAAPLASA